MTTQDYARIYGLDIPAKVRINQSGDRLCLTDMNEALIVGPHGELIDRMSNPWAKTYVSAKSYDFSADDIKFQQSNGWKVIEPYSVEIIK